MFKGLCLAVLCLFLVAWWVIGKVSDGGDDVSTIVVNIYIAATLLGLMVLDKD